jgi:hypothetical protein
MVPVQNNKIYPFVDTISYAVFVNNSYNIRLHEGSGSPLQSNAQIKNGIGINRDNLAFIRV